MNALNKIGVLMMCMIPLLSQGQSSTFIIPTEKGIIYNSEQSVDLRVNTNGFSIGYNQGKIKTFYKTNIFYFDITLHRDIKENRQNNKVIFAPTNETSTAFYYGKTNSLYTIKAGKGIKRYWSDKATKKGVMVGYLLEGGITVGILQPYYIKVATLNEDTGLPELKEIKYGAGSDDLFLDNSRIFGRASLSKGLFESTFIPGIHLQAGLHSDFGKYDDFLKALQVGIMANIFTQPIQLMVNQPKRPYMLNLYLSLQFGRRR